MDNVFDGNNLGFDAADTPGVSADDFAADFSADFEEFDDGGFDFGPEGSPAAQADAAFDSDTIGFASGFPDWDLLPPEKK